MSKEAIEFTKLIRKQYKATFNCIEHGIYEGGVYRQLKTACDIIDRQADKIKRLEEENRWVPVSERLPEKNILVYLYQNKPIKCMFEGMLDFMNGEQKWVDKELYCVDNITHWKPIVLPPQENEAKEKVGTDAEKNPQNNGNR